MRHIRALLLFGLSCVLLVGLAGCDSGGPGTGDTGIGDSTTVSFAGDSENTQVTVNREVGSYTREVVITDPGFKEIPVDVLVTGNSTAVVGEDVDGLSQKTTITFPKETTNGASQSLEIQVLDLADPTGGDKRRRTLSLKLSIADSVDATVGSDSTFTLTIEERLTPGEARTLAKGTPAIVEGTVTRVLPDGVYLQEDEGLFVADADVASQATRGDRIRLDGETGYAGGLFQLSNASTEAVLSTGNALPEPEPVSLDTIRTDGERFESELVNLQSLIRIETGGDQAFQEAEYGIQDTDVSLSVPAGSGLISETIPTPLARFQGVLTQSNGQGAGAEGPNDGYQLLGAAQKDVQSGEFTIAEVRQQDLGTTVAFEGTVTRSFGSYARIQDDSGPTGASALLIRQTSGSNASSFQADIQNDIIKPGTVLRITGQLSQFSGLEQIDGDDLVSYEVVEQGSVPSPQTVSLSDLEGPGGEDYESELLRVEGLSFPSASGQFQSGSSGRNYTVEDSDGNTFTFRVQTGDESNIVGEPIPTGTFAFEGVLAQFNNFNGRDDDSGYQLLPVQPSDLK